MSARQAARWKRAACPALARDAFSKSKIWGRHRGFGMQLGELRLSKPLREGAGERPGGMRRGVRGGAFLAPGCSIIRASLPVALMVSLPRFGSLWAFGPTAHRADASLRALRALETLARCGLRGWCGRTARTVGAETRLPWQERAHAAELLTGRGRMARRYVPLPAASRVSCA